MRPIMLWAVVVTATVILPSCRRAPSVAIQNPATATTTYQNRDGLQITPLEAGYNEIADILDLKRWRFRVVCPSANTVVHYTIELHQEGQPPQKLCDSSAWTPTIADSQMVVALYPIGNSIGRADTLKTYIQIGRGNSSSVGNNPLKGFSGYSVAPVAKRQEDESFLLMDLSPSGRHPDPNNTLLVLTISSAPLR